MDKKKITIQDLAKYANVSVGTVDRVIHNRGKVSSDKKQRIEEAIREMDFSPNFLARTLALKNRFIVCTLFPMVQSKSDYWSMPKQGVDQVAARFKDFGVTVEPFNFNLFDESSFVEQAGRILKLNPDGVIFAPLFTRESITFVQQLKEKNIPYIFIDANIPGQEGLTYIGPDVKRSGYIAGKLLDFLLAGNDEVLILNIVKGLENSSNHVLIVQGFEEYFAAIDTTGKNKIHSLTINSTEEQDIFRELTKFYIKNPNVKGVFVTNSKAHLIAKFNQYHDLDIKVVGFDLIEENVKWLNNGGIDFIISQSPVQQGMRAIQSLFDLFIYNHEPKKIQYVPLDIIIPENVGFYINFH